MFTRAALEAGGKPSTWLPPGRLVEHYGFTKQEQDAAKPRSISCLFFFCNVCLSVTGIRPARSEGGSSYHSMTYYVIARSVTRSEREPSGARNDEAAEARDKDNESKQRDYYGCTKPIAQPQDVTKRR